MEKLQSPEKGRAPFSPQSSSKNWGHVKTPLRLENLVEDSVIFQSVIFLTFKERWSLRMCGPCEKSIF